MGEDQLDLALVKRVQAGDNSAFDLLADWGPTAGISSITTFESLNPLVTRTAQFNGSPSGDDFPLTAGSFVWAQFAQPNMADLGEGGENTLNLATGLNAFSHTGFPINATAHQIARSIGTTHLKALRFFDAFAGQWRTIETAADGSLVGPDFAIPRVATLLVEMKQPVTGWKP